jgi:hypothetical protein
VGVSCNTQAPSGDACCLSVGQACARDGQGCCGNGIDAACDPSALTCCFDEHFICTFAECCPSQQLFCLTFNSQFGYCDTAAVSTLVGDGGEGFANGNGEAAYFASPAGMVLDSDGGFFVADETNNAIRYVDRNLNVFTIAGLGYGRFGFTNGDAGEAMFALPRGVALDDGGNVYVADTANNLIRQIDPTGIVRHFAGDRDAGFRNGGPVSAEFNGPTGIVFDGIGNLYVADSNNNMIREISLKTGVVSTYAGVVDAGWVDGDPGEFNSPQGLAIDGEGNLYIADTLNNAIRMVTPPGVVSTIAGRGPDAGGLLIDGDAGTAALWGPAGITFDGNNLYVADTHNNSIRLIDGEHNVATLAGNGFPGGANGLGTLTGPAKVTSPAGIVITPAGVIYVGDTGDAVVRAITFP